MNIRDVAGVSTPQELYEIATVQYSVHAGSMDKLIRFVADMQRRAIEDQNRRYLALDRMAEENERLGLCEQEIAK